MRLCASDAGPSTKHTWHHNHPTRPPTSKTSLFYLWVGNTFVFCKKVGRKLGEGIKQGKLCKYDNWVLLNLLRHLLQIINILRQTSGSTYVTLSLILFLRFTFTHPFIATHSFSQTAAYISRIIPTSITKKIGIQPFLQTYTQSKCYWQYIHIVITNSGRGVLWIFRTSHPHTSRRGGPKTIRRRRS